MVRGPAPTPKHILSMRGSKDAKYREELGTPATALPEPPEWLRPSAKAMFRLVCEFTQQMGTLCNSDTQVITRYAIVWDKWQEAEQQLAKTGECWREVLAPDGSLRFCRPTKWQSQSNHCHEQLRQLETVLGLTPADRTRLGYGAVKVVNDPVDALFDNDAATG
jgi:P27 family predicted phage terminase small subunit